MNIEDTDIMKADKRRKEVFRLTDMTVKEVSIVDRPANLRPFALIKAEASQGAELEPDGIGGFRVKAAKAEPEVTPVVVEPVTAEAEVVKETHRAEVDDALITAALANAGPSEVEKVGRKIATKREKAIRDAIELLLSVLDETTKAVGSVLTANKSLSEQLAKASAALATARHEHETLKSEHVAVVRAVSKARGTVQRSNALTVEGEREVSGRVSWPSDLNK